MKREKWIPYLPKLLLGHEITRALDCFFEAAVRSNTVYGYNSARSAAADKIIKIKERHERNH
jgi:hypothetical protein